MTNLNPLICQKIKEARRAARLSQSMLAAEVGCKQSALSMFEQGDGTKLNDDVIGKLADKFGIDISSSSPETSETVHAAIGRSGEAFCPNPGCPSNHGYQVEGRRLFRPDRLIADPVGGRFCAACGEVLERRCPNCGADLHDGAVCSFCGVPYIVI